MTYGGKRPNAGRPIGSKSKKTLEQEALRDYIFSEVKLRKKEIVKALLDEALRGQIPAIKELLDRAVGKVKDEIEMRGSTEQPIEIKLINYADVKK
jgi:hypothetical protein